MFVSFFFYKHGTQQLTSSSAGLDMQLTNLILCEEYNGLIKGNERHKEILVEKNIISRGRGGFGQKSLLVFAETSLFKGRLSFFPILSSPFGTLYKKNQLKT